MLRPDIAMAAVEEALRRLRPESAGAERTRLEAALRQIEGQLANLTAAVAGGGGDTATLVNAVKDRERELARLTRAWADLETPERLTTLDTASLERRNSLTSLAPGPIVIYPRLHSMVALTPPTAPPAQCSASG